MTFFCVFKRTSDLPGFSWRCEICHVTVRTKRDAAPKRNCPNRQFDCAYRGEAARTETCEVCGSDKGKQVEIYSCRKHGECVVRQHRTPAAIMDCIRCKALDQGFRQKIHLGEESYPIELPPENVTPTRPRAIVTAAFGEEHLEILAMTRPSREQYAARFDCDLIELTDDRFPRWPMANKWRAGKIAAHYDQTLWVDSDVFIKPDAPSVFSECGDRFGLMNEMDIVKKNGFSRQYQAELEILSTVLELPTPTWSPNGGVLVIPRQHASLYSPPPRCPVVWCLDQHYLAATMTAQQVAPHFLSRRWNLLWIDPEFWRDLPRAHFVHLNGTKLPARRELMRRLIAGNYEPTKLDTWEPKRC